MFPSFTAPKPPTPIKPVLFAALADAHEAKRFAIAAAMIARRHAEHDSNPEAGR